MTASPREPLRLPENSVPDPRSAPPMRWGLISPGHIADDFTRAVHSATASRVVAVTSRSQERAESFAREHGIDAAYDDVAAMIDAGGLDAVYVASPHAQHHEYARPALEAEIPTLVEKAFALNTAQAEDLIGLARERGVFLMEAMWARFLPQYDVLRQVVAAGILGDLVLVRADHGQHFPEDPAHRLYAPGLGGGALLDLGVYPISLAQMLLGDLEELAVRGDLASTGVDATVTLLARGVGGGRAVLDTTLRTQTPNEAVVAGTLGRARLQGTFYAPGVLEVELHDGRSARFEHPGSGEHGLAFEAAEVARMLATDRTESPLMPWADTLSVQRTLDAARAALGVRFPGEKA